mgnify:CR=1 FL=1
MIKVGNVLPLGYDLMKLKFRYHFCFSFFTFFITFCESLSSRHAIASLLFTSGFKMHSILDMLKAYYIVVNVECLLAPDGWCATNMTGYLYGENWNRVDKSCRGDQ